MTEEISLDAALMAQVERVAVARGETVEQVLERVLRKYVEDEPTG